MSTVRYALKDIGNLTPTSTRVKLREISDIFLKTLWVLRMLFNLKNVRTKF